VAVIVAAITRTVTVTLALVTGVLGSATSPVPEVSARTPLAKFWLKWNAEINWRSSFLLLGSLRCHAAVIFRMEYFSKLFAIVVSTDHVPTTLLVIVTVSLTLNTGAGSSAASPRVHISSLTSWR